ncbi:hypothetical protein SAMN05428944_7922 [Streptomyces sp. 1222.5]|nr:hypothetical protein SAMN05428944_7922 [Streptomyces sp. 1222.5]
MRFPPNEFLTAMEGYRQRDPELALVLGAVKMTVKGGIGKLREKARGGGWRPGQGWPAPARPTWRPDIRAVVISRARISMHRKMLRLAAATGRYPVAVLSDCAVYAADGPGPLDVLPYDTDGKTVPGSFRLGVSLGMVKHEGTQTVLWGANVLEPEKQPTRPARDRRPGPFRTAARVTGGPTMSDPAIACLQQPADVVMRRIRGRSPIPSAAAYERSLHLNPAQHRCDLIAPPSD